MIVYAIPAFLVALAAEYILASRRTLVIQTIRDTSTSLLLGLGSLAFDAGWKLTLIWPILDIAQRAAPWQLPNSVPMLLVLFLLTDLGMYITHRMSHRIRFLWAAHSVHHSSEYFNFSTAMRQSWKLFPSNAFLAPLVLIGFDPTAMLATISLTFVYQFWVHTEMIQRCPRWLESVFNTPSHHRVHHGVEPAYLDMNFGAVLIVWDRLFGTFVAEEERPTYGLTNNVGTYNPVRVAFHEYVALVGDVIGSASMRERLSAVFGSPRRQRPKSDVAAAGTVVPARLPLSVS